MCTSIVWKQIIVIAMSLVLVRQSEAPAWLPTYTQTK